MPQHNCSVFQSLWADCLTWQPPGLILKTHYTNITQTQVGRKIYLFSNCQMSNKLQKQISFSWTHMASTQPYLVNTIHKYHTSKFNSANLTWVAPGEHIFRLTRLSWLHLGAPYLLLRLLELACSPEFIMGSTSNFTKYKFFTNVYFKDIFLHRVFFKCVSSLFWLLPTSLECSSGGDCCHQDFISNSPVQ